MRIPGTTFSDDGPSGPPAEIDFKDFDKVDLRLGTVLSAERVPDTDKLVKLQVNFGKFERQIVAGIAKHFTPENLAGKQYLFVVNLVPRKFRGGLESHGMLLAAGDGESLSLLSPDHPVPDGAKAG